MIYRSNLTCPDLTKHFKHLVSAPMAHSFGHDVPRDWGDKDPLDPLFGLYKKCGMWTHDEAAILYNVAKLLPTGTSALDIGAHTGWTSLHINAAGHRAVAVDPMYAVHEFHERARQNTGGSAFVPTHRRSDQYFYDIGPDLRFVLVVVDGDHEPGAPLHDAQGAANHLAETGVIIFHDFIGAPVREGVTYLLERGFKAKIYWTPHMVACCYRGDFTPPEHTPDPECYRQLQQHKAQMKDFDFSKVAL